MEAEMTEKRKLMSRKPKVPPVVGSKVKLDKMLKKQMKSLSISGSGATKARKINMEDSASDSEMEDSGQAAALSVPRFGIQKNRIKKER